MLRQDKLNHFEAAAELLLAGAESSDNLREGLAETPARFAKAWEVYTSGYDADVKSVLKVFNDGGSNYNQMVHIAPIPFYSMCEHHLAPIFGHVQLAYIPNTKSQQIIGLSKAKRLVDIFARRLQVQERMTVQIADAMQKHVDPTGVGVMVHARHMCMEARGVECAGVSTTTSALRGVIMREPETRAEFLALCNKTAI